MAAQKSTLPYPPIDTGSSVVVLSDRDGTINNLDSNDYLTDNYGCGMKRRRELNVEVLTGMMTLRSVERDAFREELESIPLPFEKCKEILQRVDMGMTKSQAILPYRQLENPPTLFFFGDGVSGKQGIFSIFTTRIYIVPYQISAARHADVLFVKNDKEAGHNDLAAYCVKEGIKHSLFEDFSEALPLLTGVVEEKLTVEDVLKESPI